MERSPDASTDPRAAIDALLDAGDTVAARLAAERYWRANPNASTGRFVCARLGRLWPEPRIVEHRVAILRSFTVEPVVPLLQAEAALAGCRLDVWVGGFGAYGQEILDPSSGLFAHGAQTIVLAVQTRDIAPALWDRFASLADEAVSDEIDAAAHRLAGLVESLRARTTATILVHDLEPPLRPNEGLLDARRPIGQAEAIGQVNRAIRARLGELPDVHIFAYADLQARHGRERFVSEKKWATAKLPLSMEAVAWLAQAWWAHISVIALPRAKVIAFDLDNTLWGGTVGEDGPAGLKLGDEYPGVFFKNLQRAALDIASRGVLIAIASKNNSADALQVIDEHPDMLIRREHIAAFRIDWEPKAANLVAIAQELNLSPDSIVFFDDNPVERDAVRRSLPGVVVPELGEDPSTYADVLRSLPQLERLTASGEDGARTRYYAEERQRRELMGTVENLEQFLGSLGIVVEIGPIDAMSLPRAAQLTQKTNQLNTTTRRYTEAELADHLRVPGHAGYVLRAADKFGDNGIVGVALTSTRDDVCEITSFLLSCRVIGRQIETAFLAFLAEEGRRNASQRLQGWFLPTPKNAPARDIFRQAGLRVVEEKGDAQLWALDLSRHAIARPEWIQLNLRTAEPAQ